MFGRKTLDRLDKMLDEAVAGSFRESDYDETQLSRIETKWKRYLGLSVLTRENMEKEKESVKSLVSDISHQTKTPMANIQLYEELLRENLESGADSGEKEQNLKLLNEIIRQGEKLDFLIQSLTKLSRLESNIVEVKPACQPVLELVREAVFNTRPKAEEKGIDVRLCCEEAGNAVYDKKWTREALENVLDNAVKYSPEGSSVDVFVTEYEMYPGISVRDEGMGIREEEIPKIFGRFYRSRRVQQEDGVGIGLYLAREILKKEKGYIGKLLQKLGGSCKNIVYCNTVGDTIEFALKFSKGLPEQKDIRIDSLIELIKSYIHKDYFLIDCLKKGVAFHFGRLPQRIRERVEKLFEDKVIDYIFCTSTLLEGVNLPAKNIFIFSNAIGNSKFSDVDFWNLAGRAGRLSKELSGNIICVRMEEKKNRWDNPNKDLEVVRNKKIEAVKPLVINGQKNFYMNLDHSLRQIDFTKDSYTQTEKEVWDHYANIVFSHQASKTDSILMSNFLRRNTDGKKLLERMEKDNHVPLYILEQCSNIKAIYQNKVWVKIKESERAFPEEITYQTCLEVLERMYDYYNWSEEESKGRNPMVRQRTRLQYFAVLMHSWMKSTPLNMMIIYIINYYKKKGEIWYNNKPTVFNPNDRKHINLIINNLISDIDNVLRFKIKNYFLIVSKKNGKQTAGDNWAEYVEYGTTDDIVIELQNIGLPRHLSVMIKDNYMDFLTFEDGMLIDLDAKALIENIDDKKYRNELEELKMMVL